MTNTASTRHRGHPITVAAAEIEDLLDELIDQSTWSMNDDETRATLRELTRAEARLAELKLRVAAHGEKNRIGDDPVPPRPRTGGPTDQDHPGRDPPRRQARQGTGHRRARAGTPRTRGRRRSWSTKPGHRPRRRRTPRRSRGLGRAEGAAVAARPSHDHDAKTLRVLGKRILEVIDPAAADAHEAKLLEKEEQAAEAAAMFRMHDDGHGKCHGKFTISTRHGAMLKKALLAKAAPKHRAAVDGHAPEPGQPTAHRMGLAFQEYIESYPAEALPKAGGVNATVVVTMTLETLLGGLKAAQLDTGEKITAGEARRMACQAGIIPAVLDGKSKVLDLGRKKRFHTEANASSRPSNKAAAPPRAATGHPACATWAYPVFTDTVTVVFRATERCRDGDVSEGVQGTARRAAFEAGQELHGSGTRVQRVGNIDRELGS